MSRHRCCENGNVNRGAWTKEEDEKLVSYITSHDRVSWSSLPRAAGLVRCAKSCRLRWVNYLRPDLKRGDFTNEEDELIIGLHSLMGNKWSVIAERLPGRTEIEIKNHWNSDIKRKLRRRGLHHRSHGAGFGHEQNSTTGKGGREKLGFRNQTHPRGESSSSRLNLELELSPPCCKHPSLMLELTRPSCKHSSPTLELSPPCCKRPSQTLEFSPPCCKHTSPALVTNRSFLRSKALKITEPIASGEAAV